MFDRQRYGKILVPLVTPFAEDQSLDLRRARALVRYLVDSNNADSLVLTGTTGEFHTMTFDERVRVFELVHTEFCAEIPAIAGVGCASTIETIALAKKAEQIGFDTIMVVAPYYAKPNQRELYDHFRAVSEAVSLNIMLYNIPIFTGVNIDPDTVASLSKLRNIVAIKEEAELNPKQISAFLNATPDDFIAYNGDDTMILEAYAQGGAERIGGVISGASHLLGKRIREMIETFLAGDISVAAKEQQRLLPVFRVMGQNNRTNPVALWKEGLRLAGVDAGVPRLPLSRGTKDEIAEIRRVFDSLSLLS
ncbi:MAG: 4-hydroxy-tetrahydrodipicolinate synthase [Alkalispirochaeta sp.]